MAKAPKNKITRHKAPKRKLLPAAKSTKAPTIEKNFPKQKKVVKEIVDVEEEEEESDDSKNKFSNECVQKKKKLGNLIPK